MASGGTYRITNSSGVTFEAPAPTDTDWPDTDVIDQGLNGIPIKNDYKIHTWSIGDLEPCDFEILADLADEQQEGNAQLAELETDPYKANLANTAYGTRIYTDFVIQPLNRRRGLPQYKDVQVNFEVFTG